jgi:hypothetical protein
MLSVACRVDPGGGFAATVKLNEEPLPVKTGRAIQEGLPVTDHVHGELPKFTVALPPPSPNVNWLGGVSTEQLGSPVTTPGPNSMNGVSIP